MSHTPSTTTTTTTTTTGVNHNIISPSPGPLFYSPSATPSRQRNKIALTRRRGFATLLVFCVIVLSAIIIGMIQASAYSQAAAGREALGRLRAFWAARAGLEETIARLEFATLNNGDDGPLVIITDLESAAVGQLLNATWRIAHWDGTREVLGPQDAHAKINVNSPDASVLLNINPFMSEAVVDSIKDWIDADDDANLQGAELGYYQTLEFGYFPRNSNLRSIAELELVADVDQADVRGEDWNLNGLLDHNEDDGDLSWPPDNADGALDAAWSGILTAASVDGGLTASGQAPIDLKTASAADLTSKAQVSSEQAKVIIDYVQQGTSAAMRDFIRRDLNQLQQRLQQATGAASPPQADQPRIEALSDEQLTALLDEFIIGAVDPTLILPGKLNVNTCAAQTIEYLPNMTPEVADAIIAERASKTNGFASLVELLKVPGMTRRQLSQLYDLLCVRSNVFTVTCKGKDEKTGLEVEIQADINRSSLPVTISGVLVR